MSDGGRLWWARRRLALRAAGDATTSTPRTTAAAAAGANPVVVVVADPDWRRRRPRRRLREIQGLGSHGATSTTTRTLWTEPPEQPTFRGASAACRWSRRSATSPPAFVVGARLC